MPTPIKNKIVPLVFSVFFVACIVTLLVRAAGTVSLYLTPSSQTVNTGNSFSIAVRVSTQGNGVDYARAYLSFPGDKLSVAGISAAGSNFDYQLEETVNGNQIRITRYSTTGIKNGDLLVAIITFNAVGQGVVPLNFDIGSAVYYTGGGSNQPATTVSNGSYTIHAAPISATPPGSPAATSSPGTSSPMSSSSFSQPHRAISTAVPLPSTSSSSLPSAPVIVPPSSVPAIQNSEQLYRVIVTVKDYRKKPAAGVEIAVGKVVVLTNDLGSVALLLPAGEQTVYVKSAKVSKRITFNVAAASLATDAAPQEFNLILSNPGLNSLRILKIMFGLAIALLLIISTAFTVAKMRHKRRRLLHKRPSAAHPGIPAGTIQSPGVPTETLPELKIIKEALPTIKLHKSRTKAEKPPVALTAQQEIIPVLHPHDLAKTIQPLTKTDKVLPTKPALTTAHSTATAAPLASLPEISEIPKASFDKVPKRPKVLKTPPPVDPYKPDGEPKDIFEMAEERFNNDDRLKSLRK